MAGGADGTVPVAFGAVSVADGAVLWPAEMYL